MTIFPNSPILLMNRIVLMDPVTSAVRRIIALQYNPASILRALQMQGVGGESGDRSEALRLKEEPVETIKVEAKIDAVDQRHLLQARVTNELPRLFNNGVLPNLIEGVALPRLSTRGIQLTVSNNSTQISRQIVQSVYGGIGHE